MQTLHFLYHEIRPAKSNYAYAIELDAFEAQAKFLADRIQAATEHDSVTPVITFDDGHLSNYEYALPVLTRLNLTAHFFITAGWTGQRANFMGWPELRALHRAGQQLGAHGWSHTLLTHCNPDALQHELSDSRRTLEDGLSTAITTMSLPGGRSNQRVLEACWAAGYERVYTSEPRVEETPPAGRLNGRFNLLASSNLALLDDLLAPHSRKLAAIGRQYRIKRTINAVLGDTLYAKVWGLVNKQGEGSHDAEASA